MPFALAERSFPPAMNRQAKRSLRRLWFLLLLVFGVPAAYVLSVGPVVFIWHKFNLSDKGPVADVVFAIYEPLEDLPHDSAIKKALDIYVGFWDPRHQK